MSVYDWIKMHASTHGYGSKLAPYTCAAELIPETLDIRSSILEWY